MNEDLLPDVYYKVSADRWNERGLTPPDRPIDIPAYLGPGWEPDWSELHRKTPKDFIRVARNEKTGVFMYYYLPTDFYIRKLDKIFRGRNWGTEIVNEGWTTVYESGNREYVVVLQIVAPGMFRPVQGVGSSVFRANNPQDTEAKTRAAAYTAALKNACKAMGIGRDIEEDEGEVAQLVTERHNAISLIYRKLQERGFGDRAQEIIKRYAPTSLLQSGDLLVTSIDFEYLEVIQRELSNLATQKGS